MTINELELWQKIKDFKFDRPNIKLTFAKRLSQENNFPQRFTNEIIEEYKKFIFLCCISKQHITPSHYVDLAWHLHLTYTKSYWIDLCKNTIEKEIHHNPTEGGKMETNKFKNCYNYTIELYKDVFNENPPKSIWQNDIERFKIRTINIDKSKNWVISKPTFLNLRSNISLFGILIFFSLIFYSCNQTESVAIPILFFVCIFGFIIFAISKSANNKQNNNNSDAPSTGCGTSTEGYSKHNNESDIDGNDSDSVDGGDSGGDGGGCSGCGGGD